MDAEGGSPGDGLPWLPRRVPIRVTLILSVFFAPLLLAPFTQASAAAHVATTSAAGRAPHAPREASGVADGRTGVGAMMGEPVACAPADLDGTGNAPQPTTPDRVFRRRSTSLQTRASSPSYRALTSEGLAAWPDSSREPPDGAEEPALATPEAGVAAADWEATPLSAPVLALFTPASGAFFARTDTGAMRSDDGGDTWRPVPLPPGTRLAAVDPTNHAVLYAAGAAGLYRTTDAAATWQFVLPLSGEGVMDLAVSPASSNLLYLGLAGGLPGPQVFRFVRSRDGGTTWDQLDRREASLCGLGLPLLQPHPADPRRLFRVQNCYAGRTTFDALSQSQDQGASFTLAFWENFLFVKRLVGGRGSAPERWYLAADRDERLGGSTVWRSDDDGRTWTETLAFERAWTPVPGQKVAPDVDIGGLAYDPARPDRVFIALAGEGEGVQTSLDGGASWQPLGRQDLGRANALALGIDGQNLYTATERGLWRLRLPSGDGAGPEGGDGTAPPD